MPLIEPKFDPSSREVRQFATIGLPGAFAVLGLIAWYHSGALRLPVLLWGIGLALGTAATLAPLLGRLLFLAWTAVTYPIGWLMSHLLLGVIYFGVMTPIGLVLHAVRRDVLHLRPDRGANSYWTERGPLEDVESYFRRF